MPMKMLRPDSKGRIVLGIALTKGISGFSVHQNNNGSITLKPFIEIPADESWLYNNKSALNKVKIGLEQATNNKLVEKGNFSQFAEDDIE